MGHPIPLVTFLFIWKLHQVHFVFLLVFIFGSEIYLGSYSNYKFIISFSIFNRMGLWRTLCLQSYSLDSSSILFCWNIEKRKEIRIKRLDVRNQMLILEFHFLSFPFPWLFINLRI